MFVVVADVQLLVYNGGRDLSRSRQPVNDDGDKVWLQLSNTKLALVSVAITDWAVRSEHQGCEAYDIQDRSFNTFGDVWLDDIYVECRSSNDLVETVRVGRVGGQVFCVCFESAVVV